MCSSSRGPSVIDEVNVVNKLKLSFCGVKYLSAHSYVTKTSFIGTQFVEKLVKSLLLLAHSVFLQQR